MFEKRKIEDLITEIEAKGYTKVRDDDKSIAYVRKRGDRVEMSPSRKRVTSTKSETEGTKIVTSILGEPIGTPYKGQEDSYYFWLSE